MKLFSIYGIALKLHFFYLTLHELGHCYAGRKLGFDVEEIILLPIGGAAIIKGLEKASPREEILVGIAGPLVNVFFCFVFGIWCLLSDWATIWLGPSLLTNIMLLCFNMIPMWPMDGGRIIRGISEGIMHDHLKATRFTVIFARCLIVVLFPLSIYLGFYLATMIFVLALVISEIELSDVRLREEIKIRFREQVNKAINKVAFVLGKDSIEKCPMVQVVAFLESLSEDKQEEYMVEDLLPVFKRLFEERIRDKQLV